MPIDGEYNSFAKTGTQDETGARIGARIVSLNEVRHHTENRHTKADDDNERPPART
jgi:hypothetical protein